MLIEELPTWSYKQAEFLFPHPFPLKLQYPERSIYKERTMVEERLTYSYIELHLFSVLLSNKRWLRIDKDHKEEEQSVSD